MYTGFCILCILWKQKEENIDVPVHVYWVLYSLYSLETERRKHICTCILGSDILSILWKQKEENIDVHVYWVLYSQYSLETERRKHRCICILGSVFFVFSGNRKKKT
jgi:hypothetical protein